MSRFDVVLGSWKIVVKTRLVVNGFAVLLENHAVRRLKVSSSWLRHFIAARAQDARFGVALSER